MQASTFSRYFKVKKQILSKEGFFNVSLIADLPLFIDPFHLFYSKNKEYQGLHDEMIEYLVFLKNLSVATGGKSPTKGQIENFYKFSEVRQNWFGFTLLGNRGHGLGKKFAEQLNANFHKLFKDFGVMAKPRHIEKLTLVAHRVGRDTISDFTTNLIHAYLAKKTEAFARKHIASSKLAEFTVKKAEFDYKTQTWIPKKFLLPRFKNDYVLLTPRDLLTKDDTWINRADLVKGFDTIPTATTNIALREQLISYFNKKIAEYSEEKINKETGKLERKITQKCRRLAALDTISRYPAAIDVYIREKEKRGDEAEKRSKVLVSKTEEFHETQFVDFVDKVGAGHKKPSSYKEAHDRALHFKTCIELHDLYRNLYINGEPVDEDWIQRMFRFEWYGTESDVNREPKNGLGSPDYSISKGPKDKALVEFKLASSPTLEDNLLHQMKKYKEVEGTDKGIWIVVFFDADEESKVRLLLEKHKLENNPDYILIDARKDNKIAPSKIKTPKGK